MTCEADSFYTGCEGAQKVEREGMLLSGIAAESFDTMHQAQWNVKKGTTCCWQCVPVGSLDQAKMVC
mgnify:FL=1